MNQKAAFWKQCLYDGASECLQFHVILLNKNDYVHTKLCNPYLQNVYSFNTANLDSNSNFSLLYE